MDPGLLVLLSGCPIPVKREITDRPDLTVQVDGGSPAQPVEGARVHLSRFSNPHGQYHETGAVDSDASGVARFAGVVILTLVGC